jgi:broad specificity phosphatase PhoE
VTAHASPRSDTRPTERVVELIIVRHGETQWTLTGRYTATTEIALTENGRQDAERLGPLLEVVLRGRSAGVYASPLQRAIDTAALALTDAHATQDPLLAEFDYGTYEGLTTAEIQAMNPGWDIWRDGCPDGEQTAAVGARADTFLRDAVAPAPDPVIVFSHGHTSRILAARGLGLDASGGHIFASVTAPVSAVADYHGERCIEQRGVTPDLIGDVIARSPSPGERILETSCDRGRKMNGSDMRPGQDGTGSAGWWHRQVAGAPLGALR